MEVARGRLITVFEMAVRNSEKATVLSLSERGERDFDYTAEFTDESVLTMQMRGGHSHLIVSGDDESAAAACLRQLRRIL